jgi:putative hemolysin
MHARMGIGFEILVILLLVLLNGVFAMSELAVVSSRRARLEAMARRGVPGARSAIGLAEDTARFLPTVQVGITLVGVLAGAYSGASLSGPLGAWLDGFPAIAPAGREVAFAIVVIATTYASLILGELVPKQLALRSPERVAVIVAPFMDALSRIAAPVVWLLRASSSLVLRLFGAGRTEQAVTEAEVRAIVQEGAAAGAIAREEGQMIQRVLRLGDRPVRALMTPRTEVAWIDRSDTAQDIAARLKQSPVSRFVVADGTIDNVLGIVQAKDLLDMMLDGEPLSIRRAIRQPLVLPDAMSGLAALERLRNDRLGIALVVDEYGAFEGIVTAADLLEAIVGELHEGTADATPGIVRREDGTLLLDGGLPADELKHELGLSALPDEGDYHTLAGLLLRLFRRLPREGEATELAGWRFEVVDMDGRRIDKVLVRREAPATPDV